MRRFAAVWLAALLTGLAPPAAATSSPLPGSPPGLAFHPYPARLLDTRQGGGPVGPGRFLKLPTSSCMPGCGTHALALNVVATNTSADGYFLVASDTVRSPVPGANSNQNWRAGETVAAQLVVGFGMAGSDPVYLFNQGGYADFVVDEVGYFTSPAAGDGYGQYVSLAPARLLDTRTGSRLPAGGALSVALAGRAGVPASGAAAVAVELTVVPGPGPGYLSAAPGVSSLNWMPGRVAANAAYLGLGPGGDVVLRNGSGVPVDLIVDVTGYFTDGSASSGSGALLTAVRPYRVLDTRLESPGRVGSGGLQVSIPLLGRVVASVLAVTAVEPDSDGFLVALPSCAAVSPVSNLNWAASQTLANLVAASPAGSVCLRPSAGAADLVVDLYGYFS